MLVAPPDPHLHRFLLPCSPFPVRGGSASSPFLSLHGDSHNSSYSAGFVSGHASSQSLFLRLGSLHHGNHFSWSPPSPRWSPALPTQSHTEQCSLVLRFALCIFVASVVHGLIPRYIFYPAEGCFPLYTGTRESPLTPFSVKHIDFSFPQLRLAISTAILRSGLPLTSVHLLLISAWVLALAD